MSLKPCPRCARPIEHLSAGCSSCGWRHEESGTREAAASAQPTATALPEAPFAFVPMPRFKMVLLSFTSLGIYHLVWIYRMWDRQREVARAEVSPFWRTFFAPFFAFDLFRRVSEAAGADGTAPSWSHSILAWGYFALSIAWRLPDPWWLVTVFSILPIIPVLGTVNELNRRRPEPEALHTRLTKANWAVVIIGGIVLWLAIIGTFLPDSESGGA